MIFNARSLQRCAVRGRTFSHRWPLGLHAHFDVDQHHGRFALEGSACSFIFEPEYSLCIFPSFAVGWFGACSGHPLFWCDLAAGMEENVDPCIGALPSVPVLVCVSFDRGTMRAARITSSLPADFLIRISATKYKSGTG